MPKKDNINYELPKELKSCICLFKMEGHQTWRVLLMRDADAVELYFKTQVGKNKVTQKKFFEIDRITGTFEEF